MKYMKIGFSEVIFTDKSRVNFERPDIWVKIWILSTSNVSVAKRMEPGGCSWIIEAGIVDKDIIRPFKHDKEVKLNNGIYYDFVDKSFFPWYKS